MRPLVADFHIHTVLSPCAALEMTPRNIIRHAEHYGIDIIAITDHNACDNVAAAIAAAQNTNVTVLPGMEIETIEEVHLLALFDTVDQLAVLEHFVNKYRQDIVNDEKRFGTQLIVDAFDQLVGIKPEMLLAPLKCDLNQVISLVAGIGGMCIASHIDKPAYSMIAKLGFIPSDLKLTAVEVAFITGSKYLKSNEDDYPAITSSDAHTIQDFICGPKTLLYIDNPSISSIVKAVSSRHDYKLIEFYCKGEE